MQFFNKFLAKFTECEFPESAEHREAPKPWLWLMQPLLAGSFSHSQNPDKHPRGNFLHWTCPVENQSYGQGCGRVLPRLLCLWSFGRSKRDKIDGLTERPFLQLFAEVSPCLQAQLNNMMGVPPSSSPSWSSSATPALLDSCCWILFENMENSENYTAHISFLIQACFAVWT